MPVTVTLAGPAPWGFRITGGRDFGKPITVSKVMERGKAAAGDLRLGDVIVAINGESAAEMLNVEAQNKIKQSPGQLQLQVERWVLRRGGRQPGSLGPQPLGSEVPMLCLGFPTQAGVPNHVYMGCFSPPATLGARSPSQLPLAVAPAAPWLLQPPAPSLLPSPLFALGPAPGGSLPVPGTPARRCGAVRRAVPKDPLPGGRRGEALPLDHAFRCVPGRLGAGHPAPRLLGTPQSPSAAPRPLSRVRAGASCPRPRAPAGFASARLSPSTRKPVAGVQKLHVCEKCGSTIATQAVRIQDGRYRHPSCYACADCGLNLKMRGHFWVGDELYCEKHARLRYQGAVGGPTAPPLSPHS
ncbi:PDLI2 protein, partial [Psophia crepitans]|nr:PDLI2 protein [Psophia crepitans]